MDYTPPIVVEVIEDKCETQNEIYKKQIDMLYKANQELKVKIMQLEIESKDVRPLW